MYDYFKFNIIGIIYIFQIPKNTYNPLQAAIQKLISLRITGWVKKNKS